MFNRPELHIPAAGKFCDSQKGEIIVYNQHLKGQIYPDNLRFFEPCIVIYLCNKNKQKAQFLHLPFTC